MDQSTPAATPPVEPIWCLVANVVSQRAYGPHGAQQRSGLRLLRGGAKVWVIDGFGGDGWETVTVIGHHRKSGKYLTVHVQAEHLTDWRVSLVYSPAVQQRIRDYLEPRTSGFWTSTDADPQAETYRDELHAIAEHLTHLSARLRADRVARRLRDTGAGHAGHAGHGASAAPTGTGQPPDHAGGLLPRLRHWIHVFHCGQPQ
jgi:hypothetical protein